MSMGLRRREEAALLAIGGGLVCVLAGGDDDVAGSLDIGVGCVRGIAGCDVGGRDRDVAAG
ncbi:hypothetical protein A6U89_25085 [Agrobacterium sp. B133/95]|nr:hypothetical protein [Rhizobium rhizogenes]OCJ30339.1 hypothetical protein A6U89_25085 [Agrobacterium sp. B133/95]